MILERLVREAVLKSWTDVTWPTSPDEIADRVILAMQEIAGGQIVGGYVRQGESLFPLRES